MCRFIFGLSVHLHCSVCLFLCLKHIAWLQQLIIRFKIRKYDTVRFVLLPQDCFLYLGFFVVPQKLQDFFSISMKSATGILIGIALNGKFSLDSVEILITLILPIHKHEIFFHLFPSSSILYHCHNFQCTELLFPWLNLFLIIFVAIIDDIIFLIFSLMIPY